MRKYNKPIIDVVELAIEENIAALVPKTVYKKSGSTLKGNIGGFATLNDLKNSSLKNVVTQ